MKAVEVIEVFGKLQEAVGVEVIGGIGLPYSLRLIRDTADDLAVLRRIDSDPLVQTYMYPSNVYLDLSELIEFATGKMGDTRALVYAITPLHESKMIGWVALYPDLQVIDDNALPTLEVSLAKLSTPGNIYRGVGVAAMKLVTAHLQKLAIAYKGAPLPHSILLTGYVSVGNVPAQRTLQKSDFSLAPEQIMYAPDDPCHVYTREITLKIE